jgi:hypothetical protein
MNIPAPLAAVTARISAFESYHPRLFGVALVMIGAALVASGLRPARRTGTDGQPPD